MKKKLLIIVGIVIIILASFIIYFVGSKSNQEKELILEIDGLNELASSDTIDMDKINEKLNTIITKGDYAEVEKSFKQYLKDGLANSLEMAEILKDETIIRILTAENYQEDGPDFVKTKSYIIETKQKLEDCKNKFYEFLTEEKVMSYIEDKNLDNYYIELYKTKIMADTENELNDKTIENTINEVILLLDNSENIIDFLIENKGSWIIEEDSISFGSENLAKKYNELISKL